MQNINAKHCQDFIDQLSSKISSFKEYGNQLDLLFRYAVKKKVIIDNPLKYVIYPYTPYDHQYIQENLDVQYWEKDMLKKFLIICEETLNFREYALFRTLLFTGIRKGELGALQENDINIDEKTLTINKTLYWENKNYILLSPKTKKSKRVISLDEKTFVVLLKLIKLNNELRNEHGNPAIEQFLFPRITDLKPIRLAYPNDLLESVCNKFKIKNISVHGLRHTHASMLFAAGARMKDIQMRLGHARIATTMDTYTHLTERSDNHINHLLTEYLDAVNNEPKRYGCECN